MDSDMIILEATEKMDKTIENLEKRFATEEQIHLV